MTNSGPNTVKTISYKVLYSCFKQLECFLNEVRIAREDPPEIILNMDETPTYFDMVPDRTVSKRGAREVRVRSSGAKKRRLTVVLTCTASGNVLPALTIFKGKRRLKFKLLDNVHVTVQKKGWMNADLMLRWFKAIVLPYTKGRRTLLIIDSFSAHEDQDFISEANKKNVDVLLIPGGCTSKVQPL